MSSFIEKCLAGDAMLDEIDDYVAEWHAGGDGTIQKFLGMSSEDYELWVNDPEVLALIVTAYKRKKPVRQIIEESFPLAARAKGMEQTVELVQWLKKEGLWNLP